MKGVKAEIAQLSLEYKNQLETNTAAQQAALQQKIIELTNEFEASQNTFSENHSNNIKKQEEAAAALIAKLDSMKSEASNLVQIIGNIGITGNYQNIANEDKKEADKWRNIALLLMVGMVAAISLTIFVSVGNGFDWKLAIFRLMATLILAVPATYAAKESARHRALENKNRKIELELASLDPFLAKLPEDKQHELKEKLTEKFFGSDASEHNDDPYITYGALVDLLKTAISKK